MKLITALVKFFPLIAVLLLVTQVLVSNQLATQGKDLGKLDREYLDLKDMNELLVAEVASASSIIAVRQKATERGFHEPSKDQVIHLTPNIPVALSTTN